MTGYVENKQQIDDLDKVLQAYKEKSRTLEEELKSPLGDGKRVLDENRQAIIDQVNERRESAQIQSLEVDGSRKKIDLISFGESDSTKKTLIIHGWHGSKEHSPGLYKTTQLEAAANPDQNVIFVDWGELSGADLTDSFETILGLEEPAYLSYPFIASDSNITTVAKTVADYLHERGVKFEDVSIVAHSLGAQVAGKLGEYVQKEYSSKLKKITALDPARPNYETRWLWFFDNPSYENRLDASDANTVEVIHSHYSGFDGFKPPLGYEKPAGTPGLGYRETEQGLTLLPTRDFYLTPEMNEKLIGNAGNHWDSITILNQYLVRKLEGTVNSFPEYFSNVLQHTNPDSYPDISQQVKEWVDPIILDLNNDGIQLLSLNESPVTFDLDNDGEPEPTGWSSPEDGFLAHDRNQDGKINNITELFSEYYNPNAETGLDALATLDSNKDNIIDSNDPEYANLSLWQDRNLNGTTDPTELTPLPETDITNLHLNSTPVLQNLEGNLLLSTTEFTRSDGTLGEAAEVALLIDNRDPLTGIPQNQQLVGNPPTLDTPDLEILPTDSLPLTYTHGNPVDINPLPELITPQPDIFAATTLLTYNF